MMKIAVIGSGFAGLMAAGMLSKHGHHVTVYEKNAYFGGRASSFQAEGFHFDKGPSWYWMPDIFEEAFELLGVNRSEQYKLDKLDPGFRVYFEKNDYVDIPADYSALRDVFEDIESGAAKKLDKFMDEAEKKYQIGVKEMAKFPSVSIFEFINLKVLRSFIQMDLFRSVSSQVRHLFDDIRIRKIMEFPVLFLGAAANKIPALYTMMNFSGLKQGTYYPQGGFKSVVDAFVSSAEKNGVQFESNAEIEELIVGKNKVTHIKLKNGAQHEVDVVIGAADYAHVETLIPKPCRNYSEAYWESRTFAPSSLLFYVGIAKQLNSIEHHNLFFHSDFEKHITEIYKKPSWPTDPLFYVCCPSVSDPSVAPEGCENLFFLMPIAAGLKDSVEIREQYFERLVESFEQLTGESIRDHIIFKRSYCVSDFKQDYHAYEGNAYGLANTLKQTAILKPSIKNKYLNNLFYSGQLTVPGPGVPPSLLSGELVADYVLNHVDSEVKS